MDESLRQLLTLGRGHFEKRQYPQAEQYLSEFVEQNQSFADVYNMLGLIYYDQQHYTRAQRAFEAALRINPGYTEAALSLAVVYNDLGKYAEGRKVYQAALARSQPGPSQLDPYVQKKVANLYADIGDVFAAAGRIDRALEEYRRALALEPGFIDVRLKLADACRDAGLLDESIAHYREVVAQKPAHLEAQNRLGLVLQKAGQPDEARAIWEEVLKKSPGNRLTELYLRLAKDPGTSDKRD